MKIAKKFKVIGRVQGVGFRYFTQMLANKIGIYGYVKNMFDGSVEVYAIGTDEQLQNLEYGISKGPSYSRVERVIKKEANIDNNCISFRVSF